jgi:4-hydroxybutyrate dehydrogenase/sulfolactaldehyde 3-reductase
MKKVGFIGLGRMGKPMAANLQRKGFALSVHDVRNEPVADLVAMGAANAGSPAGATRGVDVVVTMLPGPPEVEATVFGREGVTSVARPGQIVMDMSTVRPETSDHLANALTAKGVGFVDAPVGRLASHADRGESLFMVGASDRDFAAVRPLLEAMGTTIHHCGPPGSGTRT